MSWDVVIGIETHVQLQPKLKFFQVHRLHLEQNLILKHAYYRLHFQAHYQS